MPDHPVDLAWRLFSDVIALGDLNVNVFSIAHESGPMIEVHVNGVSGLHDSDLARLLAISDRNRSHFYINERGSAVFNVPSE